MRAPRTPLARLMRDALPGKLLVTTLAALALWLALALGTDSPLLGHPNVKSTLHVVAMLATGAAAVLAGAQVLLQHLAGGGSPPTGLERALVHGALTLAVSILVLYALGFDLRAVLATSALLTAGVGLAIQPTMVSMFGGMALRTERAVRIGDDVLMDHQRWRVTAQTWRSVMARHADGRWIVLPNARLAAEPLVVWHKDRPARVECSVRAATEVSPGRVATLLKEAIADFPQVDASRPITVMPAEFEPLAGATRYQIRFFVHDTMMLQHIEPEILARAWYVFQRHRIPMPATWGADYAPHPPWVVVPDQDETRLRPLVAEALRARHPQVPSVANDPDTASRLASCGEFLLFGAGERLAPPDWASDLQFLLLRGEAVTATPPDPRAVWDLRALPGSQSPRTALLRQLSDALAREIGPYADFAVARAARLVAETEALRASLCAEIDDPLGRQRFMAATSALDVPAHGPGLLFAARRWADGTLAPDPDLRARTEVAVLALPPAALSSEFGEEAQAAAAE